MLPADRLASANRSNQDRLSLESTLEPVPPSLHPKPDIVPMGAPAKVLNPVIRLVPVDMIDIPMALWVRNERRSHQPMDVEEADHPISSGQADPTIPILTRLGAENPAIPVIPEALNQTPRAHPIIAIDALHLAE